MGNEFQYHSVRLNKVIRLWWENYLLKAQTIATEQIISISELPFEAAKIPSLSCSLRNGASASAAKGSEQILVLGDLTSALGWLRSRYSTGHCLLIFLPGLSTSQALPLWWGVQGPILSIHIGALGQWLICPALQSSAWDSPDTGASTMTGMFSLTSCRYSCSRPRGTCWIQIYFNNSCSYYTSLLLSLCPNIIIV